MQKASSVSGEGRREGSEDLPAWMFLPGKGSFFFFSCGKASGRSSGRCGGSDAHGPLHPEGESRCPPGLRAPALSLWPLRAPPAARAVIYGDSPQSIPFSRPFVTAAGPGPGAGGAPGGGRGAQPRRPERSSFSAGPALINKMNKLAGRGGAPLPAPGGARAALPQHPQPLSPCPGHGAPLNPQLEQRDPPSPLRGLAMCSPLGPEVGEAPRPPLLLLLLLGPGPLWGAAINKGDGEGGLGVTLMSFKPWEISAVNPGVRESPEPAGGTCGVRVRMGGTKGTWGALEGHRRWHSGVQHWLGTLGTRG